jgi:hypothetical protein
MAKTPSIRNIDDIRGSMRLPVLIHLNGRQWRETLKLLEPREQISGQGIVLNVIPDPNGDVVIFPQCQEASPDVICKVDTTTGLRTATYSCGCRDRNRGPRGDGSLAHLVTDCQLQLAGGRRPVLSCVQQRCKHTCRLSFARAAFPGGSQFSFWQVECSCVADDR